VRKIKSEKQRNHLKNKFHILEYYHGNISSKEELAVFLKEAKRFRDYLCFVGLWSSRNELNFKTWLVSVRDKIARVFARVFHKTKKST
jgi:hypothetical protein